MIEISELDVAYGESQVLFGVSLAVEEGEFVAMIGPNGAGKSTLMRTIAGELTPASGQISFKGQQIGERNASEIARRGLIHVPQDQSLFDELTVLDNLRAGSYMKRVRDRREENLSLVFDLFPRLAEREQQFAGTLSGGERRMLAIAKGLMAEPELILFDEPSAGLAPNLVELTFERLEQIRAETGTTILLVEQRVIESLEIAERGYVLENGQIELSGPTDDLLESAAIQESYLGL